MQSEGLPAPGPRSRSASLSSDSQLPRAKLLSPPPVIPSPAFIAPSAASQILTTELELDLDPALLPADEADYASAEGALVSAPALASLNAFLDHLLFNILAVARSTQLTCIRPAVAEVLKPRFAKEIVAAADEELGEYMGGAEDEELDFRGGQDPGGEFDLIRSWKLTRLRCMVYTRLGDMEEDDEDDFIVQEGLDAPAHSGPRRFASHVGNITPAAAIFLTSIIEHIGEQALVLAGETACLRVSRAGAAAATAAASPSSERAARLVVEESDMEKLALNPTLGRLWRTWRKRVRAPTISRAISREFIRLRGHSYSLSTSSQDPPVPALVSPEPIALPESEHDSQETETPDDSSVVDPGSIPLPESEHDVQEIEIPGFSVDPDVESDGEGESAIVEMVTMQAVVAHKVRPRSLMVFSSVPSSPQSTCSSGSSSSSLSTSPTAIRTPKPVRHARSRSLPSSPRTLVPGSPIVATETRRVMPRSPSDEQRPLETMYENDEQSVKQLSDTPDLNDRETVDKEEEEEEEEAGERSTFLIDDEETAEQQEPSSSAVPDHVENPERSRSPPLSYGREEQESEVIEGQGMAERPRFIASVPRPPKRKPSRDISTTQKELRSASPSIAPQLTGTTVTSPIPQPLTQGAVEQLSVEQVSVEQVSVEQLTAEDESIASTQRQSASPSAAYDNGLDKDLHHQSTLSVTETVSSKRDSESADSIGAPPSISDASDRSFYSSRTRPRPTASIITTTTQQSLGRSSPAASVGIDRAAVQRVSPRPSISAVSVRSKSRRSDSFSSSKERRPVTSGSTHSQVSNKLKGLIGRPPPLEPASLRRRSSSDTSRASSGSRYSEDDDTNLDKLIKSNETILFTLTPKTMREIEHPDSPRWHAQKTAPLDDELPRPRTSTTSARAAAAAAAAAPAVPAVNHGHEPLTPLSAPPYMTKSKSIDSVRHKTFETASIDSSTSRRARAGQAREARLVAESTRDFAEFIKMTGPIGGQTMPPKPIIPPALPSPAASAISSSRTMPELSSSSSPSSPPPSSLGRRPSLLSKASSRFANGPKLQARAPASAHGEQTSDLIDFIREGPPPTAGARHIQRTIAPFRDPLDSDDFFSTAHRTTTRGSVASSSNNNHKSMGLSTGTASPPPTTTATTAHASDYPAPVRKQRRVRDPYDIDFDDLDAMLDEEEAPVKPKARREEESLLDFLRSATPPPDSNQPQPFLMNMNMSMSAAGTTARNNRLIHGPSPSSQERFPGSKPSRTSLRSQADSYHHHQGGLAGAGPANYTAKVGLERSGLGGAASSSRSTETSALADFLRNTGPLEPVPRLSSSSSSPSLASSARRDLGGSFSKLFGRRKKLEA
ncbi:hypothetical protein ASPZODRAFT_129687 [Penicilliopsis zonata CBS 506.65]|uniref:Uncharacterized protein n=1 Tax=Penicilliopsis zonata CBS 506.65 TaxID=1073090 RepID=A0A1L9SQA9_9EURO|nr:hypothetical protein ASPZODRAFT_129687 [Penicilliopsis zonata CBS 506.65]OJJ49264.1 hypothetical protein ASPZODRAFT_129687 [Penicilliopsis zonata CBS 506.65]